MQILKSETKQAASLHKRNLILSAARDIFEQEGLERASLRAIALRAGYTPAAIYFHFDSKEALYSEILEQSLTLLRSAVETEALSYTCAREKLRAAAMAFFLFYTAHPRDLELGFYLIKGGLKPTGLGRERDERLNEALDACLKPIAEAGEELGLTKTAADLLKVEILAHAVGLLLLLHTGRIKMFSASTAALMDAYISGCLERVR